MTTTNNDMKKTYTIQISQKITVSRSVKAESIEEAVEIAQGYAAAADITPLVKPARAPWGEEWKDECEVQGVFA